HVLHSRQQFCGFLSLPGDSQYVSRLTDGAGIGWIQGETSAGFLLRIEDVSGFQSDERQSLVRLAKVWSQLDGLTQTGLRFLVTAGAIEEYPLVCVNDDSKGIELSCHLHLRQGFGAAAGAATNTQAKSKASIGLSKLSPPNVTTPF